MSQEIDIDKLAKLSRLKISGDEIAQAKERLQRLLGLMDNLKTLDLSNVEPMIASAASALRDDVPAKSLSYEQAFCNAPKEENRHFAIPKVM